MDSRKLGAMSGVPSFRNRPWRQPLAASGRPLCGWIWLLAALLWIAEIPLRAQPLVLSEFVAANDAGERDEDGDRSDWLEIYNPGPGLSLAGWHLTDDRSDLTLWQFPELTLAKGGFVVVFASGKDRRDPKGPLHTNFKLSREGEYLALIHPDGETIAWEYAPKFPPQLDDVSYGAAMSTQTDWLLPPQASGRMLVPSDNRLGQSWVEPGFDDSTWDSVTPGIGYQRPAADSDPLEPSPPLGDVSQPGDVIVPTSANSPGNEGVHNAIDNNPQTKYLNFDKLNAGLTITPGAGATVITGLRFTSANDVPDRDPTSFVLSGSNDGQTFSEVAKGSIPEFSGRFTTVEVAFANAAAYTQYRLLFPTVRNPNAAVAMQIAEIEFLGRVGPPLPAFSDLLQTSVESAMFGRNGSVYLRLPFTLQQVPAAEDLSLRVRYDDGFAAWLNGVLVARANAPQALAYFSVAWTNRFRQEAVQEARFDLSAYAHLLRPGINVVAIQGLNDRIDSPDFLLDAQLANSQTLLGATGYFDFPTPGKPNSSVSLGLVSELVVAPERGFCQTPVDVTLSCSTEETAIRWTTDGTVPTPAHGTLYTGPIRIGGTTILRAAAFREGWRPSPLATHTYIFVNDVAGQSQASALAAGFPSHWGNQAADYALDTRVSGAGGLDNFGGKYHRTLPSDLLSLPTMSIVMNASDLFGPQGVYANPEARGAAWERPASLELIYPGHPGQRSGFQQDAGIRIQGGAFRRFDLSLKKSFRMVFRKEYGSSKLRFPLFGPEATDQFDNFVLRANSNDAWPYGGSSALYVRDTFAMETARAMGRVASHSTFVHLYLNGLYWGLYNPVERPDAAFSASYHGGNKDSWDAINQDSVPDGNGEAWNRLLGMLSQDMSRPETYQRLQGNNPDGTPNPAYEDLLDVENMIDYMILNFYVGNADWPGRNWWVGRDRDDGDGFKFYPWDTETALGLTAVDFDCTGVNGAVARPYAALRANAEFRMQFADRVYRHFFNDGVLWVNPDRPDWDPARPQDNRPAARFAALAELVASAVVAESARWGDQLRASPYTRDEHWQPARDKLFASYFPRRSAIVLEQFRRTGLYPRTEPPSMNQRGGQVPPGFALTLSAPVGTIYYTLDGTDPQTASTALKYTAPVTLNDLTSIKARVLNGQEWSALNAAIFQVGSPSLTLTELHYHPAAPDAEERAAGFTDANLFEFVELFNNGTVTCDLAGAAFVTGIQFQFSLGTITRLAPGDYLLVVKNRAAFERRYGTRMPIAGEYAGQLDNAGERVRMVSAGGETILDFSYRSVPPWPESANGAGPSLELLDPLSSLSEPAHWSPSTQIGGSPGRPNSAAPVALHVITLGTGELRLSFESRAGAGYTIYVADSLATQNWGVWAQGPPTTHSGTVEVSLGAGTSAAARFFRVSVP